MMRVGIVGGGFSGAAVATHLLRSNRADLEVTVFEPGSRLGVGLAYATPDPRHLLNVPAGKMSLFADQPDDFVDWLESGVARGVSPDEFVPRKWFGDYVESRLRSIREGSASSFRHVRARASGLVDGTMIAFEGRSKAFDRVVLAWGYSTSTRYAGDGLKNAFAPETWPSKAKRILIVGTGLTAADASLTAAERYPLATIVMVSPSGKLPEVHADHGALKDWSRPRPRGLQAVTRWIRNECEATGDWQMVFEALRPHWNTLWRELSEPEQDRFLRHGSRLLNRYRHRIPPQTVQRMVELGDRLQIVRGQFKGYGEGQGVALSVDGAPLVLKADFAIDASGPDFRIQDLDRWGLRPGPHGQGIQADAEGRVADLPGVYALGPLLRGQLWESTAVREIRLQARDIASTILNST